MGARNTSAGLPQRTLEQARRNVVRSRHQPNRQPQEATIAKKPNQAELDAVNGAALDPIIDALLEHLPSPGDYFSKDERKKWLQMIELSFDLIYDDEPQPEATDEPTRTGLHPHGG